MFNIKKVKIMREVYSTVYHVEDDGCIQEFNTLKGAEDFVKHLIEVGALPTPKNAGEVK